MATETRKLVRKRETKSMVVFDEVDSGLPPLTGSLYLHKWFAGDADVVEISVTTVSVDG